MVAATQYGLVGECYGEWANLQGGWGHAMEYEIFRILYAVSGAVAALLQKKKGGVIFFSFRKKQTGLGATGDFTC